MTDIRKTEKLLPVLIGHDRQYVMAKAEIIQTPDQVKIEINAVGNDGRLLGEFVAANEIVALSFAGLYNDPTTRKEKNS